MLQSQEDRDRKSVDATPRWVKVFGFILIVIALLFGILHVTGGGPRSHGPGRHLPSSLVGGD